MVRRAIKKIIRILHIGFLARGSRKYWHVFFDACVSAVLFCLKITKLRPAASLFTPGKIGKILIIRIDRIGDLILSTPALRAVRESFPRAEINLLVTNYTADLVAKNPFVNKVLRYKIDDIESNYDLAIVLHPGILPNTLAYKSGAKWRVGYTGSGGSFYLTHPLKDDRRSRVRHEVISALEVVAAVGCSTKDLSLYIHVSDEGERFAQDFWLRNNLHSDKSVIVLHPGSRQEYLRWAKEGFAALADRLMEEKHCQVLLIGAEAERALVEEVTKLMKHSPVTAVGMRLSNLISLIGKSQLFIGHSTGPMHIAAALKVPVVAIFGPKHPLDSPEEWGPWGNKNIIIRRDLSCLRCHPSDCRDFACITSITTGEIFQAAQSMLNS